MAKIKRFDFEGKELDELSIDDNLLNETSNIGLIKHYIIGLRYAKRQWSANTKTRSEVNLTGKKPFAQKGLGRARQGSFAAPHFKGGGVAFGPKPKFDVSFKINKKEKRKAIFYLLMEKVKEDLIVVDEVDTQKTKQVFNFLKNVTLLKKNILFITDKKDLQKSQMLNRCLKNIKKARCCFIENINGYDIIRSQKLIVVQSAFDRIVKILSTKSYV